MSDFLTRLVGRTVGDSSPVRPRLPSRFENGLQVQPVVDEVARVETAPPPQPIALRVAPPAPPRVEPLLQEPRHPVSAQAEPVRPQAMESVPEEHREHEPTPASPVVLAWPHTRLVTRPLLPPSARVESQARAQPSAAPASLVRPAVPEFPVTLSAPLAAPLRPDPPQLIAPLVRTPVRKVRPPAPPSPQQSLPARPVETGRASAPPLHPTSEINVTIGRIEVRAVAPTPALPSKPAPVPKLTLDSYLRSFPRGRA